jgi:Domain of unknown function (DUF4129)
MVTAVVAGRRHLARAACRLGAVLIGLAVLAGPAGARAVVDDPCRSVPPYEGGIEGGSGPQAPAVATASTPPYPPFVRGGVHGSTPVLRIASGRREAEGPSSLRPRDPSTTVRRALEKGKYPWYDAGKDAVRPVWPPREWDLDWLERWLRGLFGDRKLGGVAPTGEMVALVLAVLGLTILLAVLVVLWRTYRPEARGLLAAGGGPGGASRVEGLPEGLRPETDDPWAEAVRCRSRGDYARAVVCLFAHQLLTLDRLRLVRLVPGRTGRQIVRAIADGQLRGWVEPTLRLFERVYYGHQPPSAEAFEAAWADAESFQRRVAEGVAP